MGVDPALAKLDIAIEEMDLLVLQLALQYSGGHIQTPNKPRKTPGTGGQPVLNGRPRQPVIARHFTFANQGFYPPLTMKYAARKAALFGLKPMLVRTGKMRSTIVSRGTIKQTGPERALITWKNVPNYTLYQKTYGRDPIKPNKSDRALLLTRARQLIKRSVRRRIRGVTTTQPRTGRIG